MSVLRVLLLASLLFSMTGGSALVAAGPDDASAVALVDIQLIFSKHERYKQRIEGLGKKAQALQKELAETDVAINRQIEHLKDYTLGSPDFRKLEEEIARQRSDHSVTKQLKQREVREEEARIHYEIYEEIVQEVRKLATKAGCTLVLRFDSQEIDQRNPAAVQQGITRMVVYYDKEMDMTPVIIEALNKNSMARGGDKPLQGTKLPVKGPR